MARGYSEQTKARARMMYDQGMSVYAITKHFKEFSDRSPSATTIGIWVNPEKAEQELQRKRERDYRDRESARKWDNSGAGKHSKPRRSHYCGCDHKIALPTLRPSDPRMCVNCSHAILEADEEDDEKKASH